MRLPYPFACAIAAFLFALHANAVAGTSIMLPMATFSFETTQTCLGKPMAVQVTGTQSATGMTALVIKAFGKEYRLSPKDLDRFKGSTYNGAWAFYEAGEAPHHVYVMFVQGVAFGTVLRQLVSVAEDGKLEVTEPASGPFRLEVERTPPPPGP